MSESEHSFRAMGCTVRITVGGPPAEARAHLRDCEAFVHEADARLSRFRPGSELCALNADARVAVPASDLLRAAVRAGLWAAEATGGLVDPTVIGALERAGYAASREGAVSAPLSRALLAAPPRRPARPAETAAWRSVSVDDGVALVRRPPGVRLDTGGTGKGLVADLLAERLDGVPRFAIDCGGDLRIGGADALVRPYPVDVVHPLSGEIVHTLAVGDGAVATSGLDVQIWRRHDGRYAHHLLDPATGEPAWTGLAGVTALGATALEAETLAKAALLSGAAGARRVLRGRGGLLVHDGGRVELVGPLRPRRLIVRLPAPMRSACPPERSSETDRTS